MNARFRKYGIVIRTWILLSLVNHPFFLSGQVKSIGIPLIKNYTRETYKADAQNWDILEDRKANMYFANNMGVLRFDGEEWQVFPVMNNSPVRSLGLGEGNEVYVGALNEIGVIKKSCRGLLSYRSLNGMIPDSARDFDNVWKIYNTPHGIIFQSFEYLFLLKDNKINVIKPLQRFGYSFSVRDVFYVVEKNVGLRTWNGRELVTVCDDPVFTNEEIRFILPHFTDDLLIGTLSGHLYNLKDKKLVDPGFPIEPELLRNNLYSGTVLKDQYILGTIKNGLFICDSRGNPVNIVNRLKGLQNNTVLSVFTDRKDNLWLGLDNGIDYIFSSLPVSYLNYCYNLETVYSSIEFGGRLYVGTNQGLFTKRISELADPVNVGFQFVESTDGQVWDLAIFNGQLLCGHNNGTYLIKGRKAEKIADVKGVWNFFRPNDDDRILLSGTYNGLIKYTLDSKNRWSFDKVIEGLNLSSKDIIVSQRGDVWMSHTYQGLFKIQLDRNCDRVLSMTKYDSSRNLPPTIPYMIHELNGTIFVTTGTGNYEYDPATDEFFRSEQLNEFFGDMGTINHLETDNRGNIWYFTNEKLGFFKILEDGTYRDIYTPFMQFSDDVFAKFENIYIADPDDIYIGTHNGLIHYDPTINKAYFDSVLTYIKNVEVQSGRTDSLWYYRGNKGIADEELAAGYSLPHGFNTIKFRYICTDIENSSNLLYSYALSGFTEQWSPWSPNTQKEYTNLRTGSYTFKVKARNMYGGESSTDEFSFEVRPPFYASVRALLVYAILGISLIVTTVLLMKRRIRLVRITEKNKHLREFGIKEQELTEQKLLAEQEATRLRNEKLITEMNHKNKELVNSTYHIIQKNKLLNSLKKELSGLITDAKSETVENELQKITRKIDRDIRHDKNWEVFERYFDSVHQEFLKRLKENHPDLTPKEMRLSAYLRMNISTKEIAPLMNISVRGVEISRYRLRKKLQLDRNQNLTEYILGV